MVAAIDATPLTVTSGGVRRYTEELTRALAEQFPGDEYHLISDQPFTVRSDLPPNVSANGGGPARGLDTRWWSVGVQRRMSRLQCDVFHGTDFSVPYLPLRPSVLTIQDLSPWMDTSWHHAADRVRRRTPLLVRLGVATAIITPTEAIKRQVVEEFRVSASRVFAVPDAAAPQLAHSSDPRHPRPYFLFAGTVEPRKNVPAAIAAWRPLRDRHGVDLLIAGRWRADAPTVAEEPGLVICGEVSDSCLAALYGGAVACVYPSLYEGFGLPPLEAMQAGCPVVASRDAALMEVCGGAAIHVDAGDIPALTTALEALLLDPDKREARAERGRARAAEYSWARTALMTREVYGEAIRRFA